MMLKKSLPAAVAGAILCLTGAAQAQLITPLAHTINMADATDAERAAGLPVGSPETVNAGLTAPVNLANIVDLNLAATSVIGFYDNDNSGTITQGDTFEDYILYRVEAFKDSGGGNATPLGYGTTTNEITVQMHINGIQGPELGGIGSYFIDGIRQWDVIYDSGDNVGGTNFTPCSFQTAGTCTDDGAGVDGTGLIVETMNDDKPPFLGSGTNANPTSPNGSITIASTVVDVLGGLQCTPDGGVAVLCPNAFESNFEDLNGNPINLILGDTLTQRLTATNVGSWQVDLGGPLPPYDDASVPNSVAQLTVLDAAFSDLSCNLATGACSSLANGGAFDFLLYTTSNGATNKAVTHIPEPGTVMLLGISALGLGASLRRRNKKKAA